MANTYLDFFDFYVEVCLILFWGPGASRPIRSINLPNIISSAWY